jgi:hypothetical protein
MANLEVSRLAKLLVDAQGISLKEAIARLSALRLEIVATDAESVSAQNALLTSVAVGMKTFVGGVRVCLDGDPSLNSSLPTNGRCLAEAAKNIGATNFEGDAVARVVIGQTAVQGIPTAYAWWDGWNGGASDQLRPCGCDENPLSGVVAGAAAVARCFGRLQGQELAMATDVDLWPSQLPSDVPDFADVYFPKALWLFGLGNLGQAFLWSLAALPYSSPSDVLLVLQDRDEIKPENWGTSVLVSPRDYGLYKTAVAERWGRVRGFDIRRCDRWLDCNQRVANAEPALAFCGFDSVESRLFLDDVGFDVIVDSGLGRDASNFDRFRTTVFDSEYSANHHFYDRVAPVVKTGREYEDLVGTDACGAAIFESIAIAAPYVSAIAGAVAVSRVIAICSGAPVPRNETRWLRDSDSRGARWVRSTSRRILRGR